MWICYSCTNYLKDGCYANYCRHDLPEKVHHCERYEPGEAAQRSMKDFEKAYGSTYINQLKSYRDISKGRWW